MDNLAAAIDFIRNLDDHLIAFTTAHGVWGTYLVVCGIVFAETGLVFAPLLPGDSLLFTCGALAGRGVFDLWTLMGLLFGATILGDSTNYWVGRFLGPRMLSSERSRLLNRKHLDRTHAFFEKYGGKTIIIARFVPIVRTFAPFVAGVGTMPYGRFLFFSLLGTTLWVGICVGAGYFFGSWPVVKDHFELVIVGIILVSLLPAVIEFFRVRMAAKRETAAAAAAARDSG